MTDLRKAAEMALEALRYASAVAQRQLTTKTKQDYSLDLMNKSMATLEAELAQPEQAPVGMTCKVWTHGCALFDGIDLPNETLLYTASPMREWVELTDEEMEDCWDNLIATPDFSRKTVYQAIEAKLKEKNG